MKEMRDFFKLRLLELLHKDTLDSFRVKVNNSNSLLHELFQLLIDWKKGKLQTFDTVKYSCQELLEALKSDICFEYGEYDQEIIIDELTCLEKSEGKKNTDYLQFIIAKLIDINKYTYLINCVSKIRSLLQTIKSNQGLYINFDILLNSFVSELIRLGYTKTYLYKVTKTAFRNSTSFDDSLERYITTLTDVKAKIFIVFFKLNFKYTNLIFKDKTLFKTIDPKLISDKAKARNADFFVEDNLCRYLKIEVEALDAHSALSKAKLKLSEFTDKLHLSMRAMKMNIHSKAYVTSDPFTNGNCIQIEYIVDGEYGKIVSFKEINDLLNKISQSNFVSFEAKERINCAIRHFHIGDESKDIEQKFINYWIGLEFIFSAPEKGVSTFARIKEYLPVILCCGYLKRNIDYLDGLLVKEKRKIKFTNKLYEANEDEIDTLISHIPNKLLIYRLTKVKALITGNSDKRSDYIKRHEKHLIWHIVRLYRTRNELIHDAAIDNSITQITSNLRYYLVYLLNQMLLYFSNQKGTSEVNELNMNDFFYEYILIYKNIKKNYALKTILNVPIEQTLIQ